MRVNKTSTNIFIIISCLILCFFFGFPVLVALFTSFKAGKEIFAFPPTLVPRTWSVEAYKTLISSKLYKQYLYNSFIICSCATALTLLVTVPGAYALSRSRKKITKNILLAIVALEVFPGTVLMLPYFYLAKKLSMYNTYYVLILLHSIIGTPLALWLLKGYFDEVPIELEEAAKIDGATQISCLIKIVLPLAAPGIVGTSFYIFILAWKEFLFSVILTEGPARAPITVGLAQLFGHYSINWNAVMAVTVASLAPVAVLFLLGQRAIISGLTGGALRE